MSKIPLTEFVSRLRSIVDDIEFAELNCDPTAAYDDFFESLRPKISQRAEWLSQLSPFDLDFWSGAELATRHKIESESKRDTRSLSWLSHELPSDAEKQAFNRDYADRFDSAFCDAVTACTALVNDDHTSTGITNFLDVLPDLRKALNTFERIDLEEKSPYVTNVGGQGSEPVQSEKTETTKRGRTRKKAVKGTLEADLEKFFTNNRGIGSVGALTALKREDNDRNRELSNTVYRRVAGRRRPKKSM